MTSYNSSRRLERTRVIRIFGPLQVNLNAEYCKGEGVREAGEGGMG